MRSPALRRIRSVLIFLVFLVLPAVQVSRADGVAFDVPAWDCPGCEPSVASTKNRSGVGLPPNPTTNDGLQPFAPPLNSEDQHTFSVSYQHGSRVRVENRNVAPGASVSLANDLRKAISSVPEPASLFLLGTGVVAAAVGLRRRKGSER